MPPLPPLPAAASQVSFSAHTNVTLSDGSCMMVLVDQLSRITQTHIAHTGTFAAYNPFEGGSSWPQQQQAGAHADLTGSSSRVGSTGHCQQPKGQM